MSEKVLEPAVARVEKAADRMAQTAATVQNVADVVDSNVSRGIQPDVRELRVSLTELNEHINGRLKMLTYGIAIAIVLSAASLLLQLR